jgi:hypothetical protein
MAIVGLLAGLSFDGSCHLARDYWREWFGAPAAQWQFGLTLLPFMVGFGVAAGLIATFPPPRLSKVFVYGSWGITTMSVILGLLVLLHAY